MGIGTKYLFSLSPCFKTADSVDFGLDKPVDYFIGSLAIDAKYRIGSGDSGTLKKFKQYGEMLKNKGYDEIITMSLHILDGIEYSKLNNKYGKISKPLLATDEDFKKVVSNEEFNNLEGNDAIVFMGHGSESAADSTYQRLQEEYEKAGKDNIFVATVEGKVTIEDVIQKLKGRGFKKILLKPFMIVAGDHAKNDMASDEDDSWKTVLENEGYEVTPLLKGMGEYEFIRKMFMDKLEEVY